MPGRRAHRAPAPLALLNFIFLKIFKVLFRALALLATLGEVRSARNERQMSREWVSGLDSGLDSGLRSILYRGIGFADERLIGPSVVNKN